MIVDQVTRIGLSNWGATDRTQMIVLRQKILQTMLTNNAMSTTKNNILFHSLANYALRLIQLILVDVDIH
jgi:hypothetical protein